MVIDYKNITSAYLEVLKLNKKELVELEEEILEEKKSCKKEDNTNDVSDDGEGLDKIQPKALKKKFDDRKDKDIDNDGDVDDSDEYLHTRRKAVAKALKGKMAEEVELDEAKNKVDPATVKKLRLAYAKTAGMGDKAFEIVAKKTGIDVKTVRAVLESVDLEEQAKAKNKSDPITRDNWVDQLKKRKGEKDFVDMHKVETDDKYDHKKINTQNFKSFVANVKAAPKRPADQTTGDKSIVKNGK